MIVIHGFYGHGNLGDEAILTAFLREVERRSPGTEVAVFTMMPERVTLDYGLRAFHSRRRSGLPRRLWEIWRSDLFVLGGGGLLKDYGDDSSSLGSWLAPLSAAKRLGVKTALYAVGVESIRFEESRAFLRDALEGVDLITVRDEESRDLLTSLGVSGEILVTADPAILLVTGDEGKNYPGEVPPNVLISVRHWFDKVFRIENREANEAFLKALARSADHLIEKHDARVRFVPLRTTTYDDDRQVAEQVVSLMKRGGKAEQLNRAPSVGEFIEMARESRLILGMRLHSLIIGAAAGTPVIAFEYMRKVRGFMRRVKQEEYCLQMEEIGSGNITSLIDETFENLESRAKTIAREVERLKRSAVENVGKLIELAGS